MTPRVLILGAGFAGHTAALHLSARLKGRADITVVAPGDRFTWFPSLIWVGTGTFPADACWFSLTPVYERIGVTYVNGKATEIRPQENAVVVTTAAGSTERLAYDYCVNATGPYLNFKGTPGLGPDEGTTWSVCSVEHAIEAAQRYGETVAKLRAGRRQRIVVGVGHPAATCEGAAFEYLMNVDSHLRKVGVRDRADLIWLTNEPEPGDFGVDGIEAMKNGRLVTGASLVRGLLDERDIKPMIGAGVTKIEPGRAYVDQAGVDPATVDFDFAMLIPQFRGQPIKYAGSDGTDLSPEMTQPSGFMNVDADYTKKPYEQYRASDWPATYRSPKFDNLYAAGIAFAPPHPISKGKKSANGTAIQATPPRTGMAAGIMGRTVALNIVEAIGGKPQGHHARMSEIPAACIASMGNSFFSGSAASMIMMPVVRDFERYPKYGRDLGLCDVDVGLAGAWTKRALHSAFMWKLQGRPGWQMVPE